MDWLMKHVKVIVWFGLGFVVGFLVAGFAAANGALKLTLSLEPSKLNQPELLNDIPPVIDPLYPCPLKSNHVLPLPG